MRLSGKRFYPLSHSGFYFLCLKLKRRRKVLLSVWEQHPSKIQIWKFDWKREAMCIGSVYSPSRPPLSGSWALNTGLWHCHSPPPHAPLPLPAIRTSVGRFCWILRDRENAPACRELSYPPPNDFCSPANVLLVLCHAGQRLRCRLVSTSLDECCLQPL